MQNGDGSFRHESLQTQKSIKALLEAITKGIGKGELALSDDKGEFVLRPNDLITLRIKADRTDGASRLDLRMTWAEAADAPVEKGALKIR